MQSSSDFDAAYQWTYRPRLVERPAWFTSWPGGAKIAFSLTVLHEWESVPRPRKPMPHGSHQAIDYLALGTREYGVRFGLPRLLDVLREHHVRATVACSGLVAELFPDSIRAIRDQGHELATHQWDQAIHPPAMASKDEERESLDRAVDALERASGERVVGYMSQGPRPSPYTLELCAEKGFLWTSDYADTDVPYVVDVNGKKLVSVGWVLPAYTDNDLVPLGLAAGLQQLEDEFDAHYEEAQRHPMRYRHAAHVHVSGRPGMARMLGQFLSYVQQHEGVWFCTQREMADFWMQRAVA